MTRHIPKQNIEQMALTSPHKLPEPDAMLDRGVRRLNLNEAPIPPSPKTVEAMTKAILDVSKYPDHSCTALARALSERLGVDEDRLFFGNGSGELLTATATIAIADGDQAVIPVPCFPTYQTAIQINAGTAVGVAVKDDGANDVEAMVAAITPKTKVVYACTPNNPTGGMISDAEVSYLADNVPDDVLLLMDEAYYDFGSFDGGPDCLALLSKRQGLWAISRTFSKAYSMAGMRVGYGIACTPALAEAYQKVRSNFTINRVALAGAVAAYGDVEYRQAYLVENARQRSRVSDGVKALGFAPYPSSTNFVTAQSPRPTEGIVAYLEQHDILIQAPSWPGSGPCLRFTIGNDEDTTALLDGLETYMKENS